MEMVKDDFLLISTALHVCSLACVVFVSIKSKQMLFSTAIYLNFSIDLP